MGYCLPCIPYGSSSQQTAEWAAIVNSRHEFQEGLTKLSDKEICDIINDVADDVEYTNILLKETFGKLSIGLRFNLLKFRFYIAMYATELMNRASERRLASASADDLDSIDLYA